MGNSGGTTLVIMSTQSSNSLDFLSSRSIPGTNELYSPTAYTYLARLTFHPDVPAGRDGKDQQEPNEEE